MPASSIRFSISVKGYTLVEMMIALALSAIVILTIFTYANICLRIFGSQERVVSAQQSARAALDLMVRDIRMAGYDPKASFHGPSQGIGILSATESMLQFTADLNADRVDNEGLENLTYFFDPATGRLRLKEGGKAYPQTFIEHVSALKFEYRNAGGAPALELRDIATVLVTLTVEEKDQKGKTLKRKLSTSVNCRNLRMLR